MQKPEHFAKYVSAKTAKLILENGTLQWSSPLTFNDPFDVQCDMLLRFDRGSLALKINELLWNFVLGNPEFAANCRLAPWLREMVDSARSHRPTLTREQFMQENPADEVLKFAGDLNDDMPEMLADFVDLRRIRILCLAEPKDSILMWSHYADHHTGAVLQFSRVVKDSILEEARPVEYSSHMPTLITEQEFIDFQLSENGFYPAQVVDRLFGRKYLNWSYEKEWRLCYNAKEEGSYTYIPFDDHLLTGIFFGCRMPQEEQNELTRMARQNYPRARIYGSRKLPDKFALEFYPIE